MNSPMNPPMNPLRLTQHFLLAVMLAGLSACAIVPGDQTYGMREQSSIKLPVKQAEELVPANVKVKPISAELIIEMEQAAKSAETLTQTAEETSRTNTNPVMDDYKIGPGDILSITVWDHPELTIPAGSFRSADQAGNLVSEDGTIFYPYVGSIQVSGKTVREVRDLLAKRLAKVIEKVQLDVRVIAFRSKRIYVVGEVKQPGLLEINDVPLTIVDAVSRTGGFTQDADHSQILLTRAGKIWRVDLQALYEFGAISQNIKLEPGDIINVPDRAQNKVFVLGEVLKPGSFFMNKKRITLAEALADAGYINQQSANPSWVFVMRGRTESPEIYHLNSKSPDALLLADRFPLHARDIVFVDTAEVARWNRVISNILPTATLLNTISGTQYPLFGGRQ
jgi:polysaccharide export outer membrane protein